MGRSLKAAALLRRLPPITEPERTHRANARLGSAITDRSPKNRAIPQKESARSIHREDSSYAAALDALSHLFCSGL